MRNPYGLDDNGRYTTANMLSPETRYGLACGLVCPECGRPLVAVRSPGKRTMSHLAHAADDFGECTGYGETASHSLAKDILSEAAAEHAAITLPPVFASDAVPHTARESREIYRHAQPKLKAIKAEIVNIWFEHDAASILEGSKIPDAIAEISYKGRFAKIAIEIKNTHAKSLEDVQEFSKEKNLRGVIEIDVSDISPTPENSCYFQELLRRRILEHEKKSDKRYWLYNPKMSENLDDYVLCLYADMPSNMYSDPNAVSRSLNYHIENYFSEHRNEPDDDNIEHYSSATGRYYILSSCPPPSCCIDNIVHTRFEGHAYYNFPGNMIGILRSVWCRREDAERLAIVKAVSPISYRYYAENPEWAELQNLAAEEFLAIVSDIAEETRVQIRRECLSNISSSDMRTTTEDKIDNPASCPTTSDTAIVITDVVKTRANRSIRDLLGNKRCPAKRLCMPGEGTQNISDERALCRCVPDCQFCIDRGSKKIPGGFDIHWNRCAYPTAFDGHGRLRPGFHKTIEDAVNTISRAGYTDMYDNEHKRRRGRKKR